MKIKLQDRSFGDSKAWRESFPFAVNPRGVLVHRLRSINTHYRGGEKSHHSATYLCGNCFCFKIGQEREVLVATPPKGRLLCLFCDYRARRLKMPDSDKLAGRHVHRGVVKAHQVCCQRKEGE